MKFLRRFWKRLLSIDDRSAEFPFIREPTQALPYDDEEHHFAEIDGKVQIVRAEDCGRQP